MHQADPDSVEKKGFKICLTNETGERVEQQKIRLFVTEASTLDRLAGRIRLRDSGNDSSSFSESDKVEALPLKDRRSLRVKKDSRYCAATITKDNGDGTFTVEYDECGPGEAHEETLAGGSGFNMLSNIMEKNWTNKQAWQKTAALAFHKSGGLTSSTRGVTRGTGPSQQDAPLSLVKKFSNYADSLGISPLALKRQLSHKSVTAVSPPPRANPIFPNGLVSLYLPTQFNRLLNHWCLCQGPLGLNPTKRISIAYTAPSLNDEVGTYTVAHESMDSEWPQFEGQLAQDLTGRCSACALITV